MNSFVYNFFYVNFLVYPALLVPIDSSRTIFINGSKPRKTPSTVIPVGSLTRTFLSMNFLSSGGWAAAMLISFTRKNKLLFPRIKNWLEMKTFFCLLLLLWDSAEFMLDHTVTLASWKRELIIQIFLTIQCKITVSFVSKNLNQFFVRELDVIDIKVFLYKLKKLSSSKP